MKNEDPTQRELLESIEAVRATLMDEARPDAVQLLAERGRLTARTRIARLVDPGTFEELGALA